MRSMSIAEHEYVSFGFHSSMRRRILPANVTADDIEVGGEKGEGNVHIARKVAPKGLPTWRSGCVLAGERSCCIGAADDDDDMNSASVFGLFAGRELFSLKS